MLKPNEHISEKEAKEIWDLPVNYNRVPFSRDYNLVASQRVDISRINAKRLLVMAMVCNLISVCCLAATLVVTFIKPHPDFYGAFPNGQVVKLQKVR